MIIKQIGIVGVAVRSGNRGVLALGSSLVGLCSQSKIKPKIVLLSGDRHGGNLSMQVGGRQQQIPIVNYRLSLKSGLNQQILWILLMSIIYRLAPIKFIHNAISARVPWISTVEQCQIVGDVRGGDSFSDIYGIRRFIVGFLVAWSVILVKGSIVQFPQTYGPFNSRVARIMARFLLRRSSMIVARDEESRKVALDLLNGKGEVKLSPDVAFSLEAAVPDTIDLSPSPDKASSSEVIGINVNGLMYNGGYNRQNMFGLQLNYSKFLQLVIHSLLEENPNVEIWLVPHTYAPMGDVESDNEACLKVWHSISKKVQSRVRVVTGEYDQYQIKGVIGQSCFFLGSRMHSCIAALSQDIPCVGLAYSMKFSGVFSSVGMGDWVIDARKLNTDASVNAVIDCYRLRDSVRDDLQRATRKAREHLSKIFEDLVCNNKN